MLSQIHIKYTILKKKSRNWMIINWNKVMKMVNGNRKEMKVKKHLKLIQLNKGNSMIDKHKDTIKYNIMELQADIITLSEADVPITSNDMKINYPDYNAELHELKGHNLVRLAVLIKKGIFYQRLKSIEMEDICLMVIKVAANM